MPGLAVDLSTVQTNIVNVDVSGLGIDAATFAAHLRERGVRGLPGMGTNVRFVTYRGITRADVEQAADAIAALVAAHPWIEIDRDDHRGPLRSRRHALRSLGVHARGARGLCASDSPSLGGVPAGAVEAEHRRLLEQLHLHVLAGRMTVDDARVERFRQLLGFAGGKADAERGC